MKTKKRKQKQSVAGAKRQSYRNYNADHMKKALDKVNKGHSVYAAAKLYGIPEQTLRDRVKGTIAKDVTHSGPKTLFTLDEEGVLVDYINEMGRNGCPFKICDVLKLMTGVAWHLKKRAHSKMLSSLWVNRFIKRWPGLCLGRGNNCTYQLPSPKRARKRPKEKTENIRKIERYLEAKLEKALRTIGVTDFSSDSDSTESDDEEEDDEDDEDDNDDDNDDTEVPNDDSLRMSYFIELNEQEGARLASSSVEADYGDCGEIKLESNESQVPTPQMLFKRIPKNPPASHSDNSNVLILQGQTIIVCGMSESDGDEGHDGAGLVEEAENIEQIQVVYQDEIVPPAECFVEVTENSVGSQNVTLSPQIVHEETVLDDESSFMYIHLNENSTITA